VDKSIDARILVSAKLTIERLERSEKLVRGGGEVADPGAGRIVDGVDDRGAGAANSQLADALAAERAAMGIVLVHEHDVHLADVGIDRDVVVRQILGDERSVAVIDAVAFQQREPMPQVMPPIICERAVFGLRMSPAANTPSIRRTRTSPVSRCTAASTKCAPKVACE
jgi:hypothetical protein